MPTNYNNHFELTLDTLAPTGTLSYTGVKNVKANVDLAHTYSTAVRKVFWTDTKSTGTIKAYAASTAYAVDDIVDYDSDIYLVKTAFTATGTFNTDKANLTELAWTAASTQDIKSACSAQGSNYVHMILKDAVNNISAVISSTEIFYDTVKPVITGVVMTAASGSTTITNKTTVTLSYTVTDATPSSTIKRIWATGTDLTEVPLASTATSQDITFDSDCKDGKKTVTVHAIDEAGNEATVVTAEISLDRGVGTVNTALYQTDGVTQIPSETYISYGDSAYSSKKIKVRVTCADTDLVAYSAWCGDDKEAKDISFTAQTEGAVDQYVEVSLGATDGTKVLHAAVKDKAGNVAKATATTICVDSVAPAVTMTAAHNTIGVVTNYTNSVITLSANDKASGYVVESGIATWTLTSKLGTAAEVILDQGTGADVPTSYTFSKAADASAAEGDYVITFTVVDTAKNSTSKNVTIKYDKTAPTAVITLTGTTVNNWYSTKPGATVNITETGAGFGEVTGQYHAAAMYAWIDDSIDNTKAPTVAGNLTPAAGTNSIVSTSISGTCKDSTTNYLHIKVIDNVGNESTTTKVFKYDATAPAKPTVAWTAAAYNLASAKVSISYNDATSGIWQMKVETSMDGGTTWSNVESANDGWEDAATAKNITLSGADGKKYVRVTVKDNAGNVSAVSDAPSTEYDRTKPCGALQLRKAGANDPLKAVVRTTAFKAHIYDIVDDKGSSSTGDVQYKITGDLTTPSADWVTAATSVVDVDNLAFTAGDGDKTITVLFKDNAGNEFSVSQTVTLDTALPGVNITDLDHQIISKVHTSRDVAGAKCSCFADEVKFKITPSEEMNEHKICAFKDITTAIEAYNSASDKNAWVEGQDAIPGTDMSAKYGTEGVSGTIETISVTLTGANYETALVARKLVAGDTAEGAHAVVVFIKDLGGNWSTPSGANVTMNSTNHADA